MKQKRSVLLKIYAALIFIFLYAPILVLVVFSFNSSNSTAQMSGLSLKWYSELAHDSATLQAFKNTMILAVLSAVISGVLGTVSAVGIDNMKHKWLKNATRGITNIPMMNPDIVTGISMMLLFVFAGRMLGKTGVLGFSTMLIAHITFCLPYVILSVLPKLRQIDPNLSEAAQDLGCTPLQSFFKVVLPAILPGVITGIMMAFTLSLDDFVISYFVSGPAAQTLPIRIFSMTKKRVTPDMYALSTIMFFAILVLMLLINYAQVRGEKKTAAKKA
ncbi:MAG: ABC transporter permease [Clostridia bacterium]|nr:ABC transporter permease [Clostridia bacterium]